ncbi:uncharacterized protein E0L32_011733 [Thyridium curvatum]|uniref:DUF6699 domain-containing protein n=1 Tax=Thyridium curvatum TaxID=1093900 RepID=A0A507BNJ5_9PEZI|nr:uncharacterized protein E0L32_011733 [Thyridium curvatum]TPX18358.1 hypothetical protein E0L32_011733 [Thyridium curvatum]
MSEPLTKVDSAVQGLSSSPPKGKIGHRRQSSSAEGVRNINDLEKEGVELQIAKETQKTGCPNGPPLTLPAPPVRKINTSPSTVEEREILKKMLTTPPVKKIDLHFPLGLEVTARNLKGVTIKDAMDAIHKAFKKRADDELDQPYLAGFEWDKEESWTRLIVHLQRDSGVSQTKSSKKKNKGGDE